MHRPPLLPGVFLVLIFRDWVDPRAHGSVGTSGKKNPSHTTGDQSIRSASLLVIVFVFVNKLLQAHSFWVLNYVWFRLSTKQLLSSSGWNIYNFLSWYRSVLLSIRWPVVFWVKKMTLHDRKSTDDVCLKRSRTAPNLPFRSERSGFFWNILFSRDVFRCDATIMAFVI
jgi:hypothetical protein